MCAHSCLPRACVEGYCLGVVLNSYCTWSPIFCFVAVSYIFDEVICVSDSFKSHQFLCCSKPINRVMVKGWIGIELAGLGRGGWALIKVWFFLSVVARLL